MAEEKENRWNRSHLWAEELEQLKAIIHATGLVETVKWGAPVFTCNGKNVLGIMGLKDYFALWFYKGVFLKDEAGMLVTAQGAKTKSLRQWRFRSADEIDEKLLLQYIYEAIEIEKAGLAIKPERTPADIAAPEFLQNALDASPALADAFTALTPGKKKEYIEYIDTAKQDKTKASRLEKIVPMILEGRGLNDKYKK